VGERREEHELSCHNVFRQWSFWLSRICGLRICTGVRVDRRRPREIIKWRKRKQGWNKSREKKEATIDVAVLTPVTGLGELPNPACYPCRKWRPHRGRIWQVHTTAIDEWPLFRSFMQSKYIFPAKDRCVETMHKLFTEYKIWTELSDVVAVFFLFWCGTAECFSWI